MVIKDKLSTVPARETHHHDAQCGQENPVGKDRFFIPCQPVTPIGSKDCQQGDGNNEMGPGRRPGTNAGNKEEFGCAGKTGKHSEQKSGSNSPDCRSSPENISRPPEQYVRTEGAECERHRKSNAHRMDGMTKNGNPGFREISPRKPGERINQPCIFLVINGILQRRLLNPAFIGAFTVLCTACDGSLSTLDPAGPSAQAIARLWWLMLAGATVIFLLVTALLALSFRKSKKQFGHHAMIRTWIVGLGLCLTLTTLAALLFFGIASTTGLTDRSAPGSVNVGARAEINGWSFSYAQRPGHITRNVLHIPAGRSVSVHIETADVIHSFWVPRLAGKLDAIPGHVNVLQLLAENPGNYSGRSSEYGGPNYLFHRFEVIAHDQQAWQRFISGVDE